MSAGTIPSPARIRRFGARCLRRPAVPAVPGDPATTEVLDRLWETLAADGGVGLAAPQIGVPLRLVVIRDSARAPDRQRMDLVNPVLEGTFGRLEDFEEGCLSFPGLYLPVRRPRGAVVSYRDAAGDEHRLRGTGLVARIAQHEIDHLDGVLFIDRVPLWRRWLLAPRLALLALGGGAGDRGERL